VVLLRDAAPGSVASCLAGSAVGAGHGLRTRPGPLPHIAVGGGLRDTFDLAWLIGSNSLISQAIAFAVAIVALRLRRPLLASLSLTILPLAALVLPTLAVYTALYSGCEANEAGVGDCVLWGARMGMSFHRAAMAPWIVYGVVPYSFTLALMAGAIGLLFFRQRPATKRTAFPRPRFGRAARSFDDSQN
jgi:hypothetical protein